MLLLSLSPSRMKPAVTRSEMQFSVGAASHGMPTRRLLVAGIASGFMTGNKILDRPHVLAYLMERGEECSGSWLLMGCIVQERGTLWQLVRCQNRALKHLCETMMLGAHQSARRGEIRTYIILSQRFQLLLSAHYFFCF